MSLVKPSVPNIDRTEQIASCRSHLEREAALVEDGGLRNLCFHVINNPEFNNAYGSATKHHNFKGGLLVHTSEVMDNAVSMSKSQVLELNMDVLRTAIVYHDVAKIFDYELVNDEITYTDHSKYIRHLAKSYAIFFQDANTIGLDQKVADHIGHCMLAHHGRKEWGSPIEPIRPEAFVIHYADMLSAQAGKDFYVRTEATPVQVKRVDKVGFGTEFITAG